MRQELEKTESFLRRLDDSPLRSNELDKRWVSLNEPASFVAEQYRTLLYQLDVLRKPNAAQAIAFTSALPKEGKTVTSVNLALCAVRSHPQRRVLLVDGDLRRRQLGGMLGIGSRLGLGEVLAGDIDLKTAVRRFRSTRLHVLTAGEKNDDVASLLGGDGPNRLLQQAQSLFTDVYIDLPPVLPFVDASLFGKVCDGVVLVVRAHATPMKWVSLAQKKLEGLTMFGCVLNASEDTFSSHFKDYFR